MTIGQAPTDRRQAFVAPFEDLLEQVRGLQEADVYCLYPEIEERLGDGWVRIGGRRAVSLVANDYLGLAGDPAVAAAARDGIDRLGTSRCASPLAGGYTGAHRALEARLAEFLEAEAAVVLPSGYQANVGAISALMRPEDLVVCDLFDHASIIDGARLAQAELRYFRHNDADHLDRVLAGAGAGRRAIVVVEGVYSADGDIVRLREIYDVAAAHGALLAIDEAHSLGLLGAGGRGAAEEHGLLHDVDLITGTMSKSLGSVGGFVAGDRQLIDLVRHNARALIFSAALPPASAEAAIASLAALRAQPERRARLEVNAERLRGGLQAAGFDTMASETAVVPVLVGDPALALTFTMRLIEDGVLVCPAIPPMVQAPRSRIRMHVTAAHSDEAIDYALGALERLDSALGVAGARTREVRHGG